MNIASIFWLVTLCFALSLTAGAEGFQPYEAGALPIKSRIQIINNLIIATNDRLAVPAISSEEKQLRLDCLRQYFSEKEQLEADLEAGRKISQLPGVTYLSAEAELKCSAGLTPPSAGMPR